MLGTPIWPNMRLPGPRLKNPSAIHGMCFRLGTDGLYCVTKGNISLGTLVFFWRAWNVPTHYLREMLRHITRELFPIQWKRLSPDPWYSYGH